ELDSDCRDLAMDGNFGMSQFGHGVVHHKLLAQEAIEVLLSSCACAGDLKDHELVGAWNAEPGALNDHARCVMFVHDLVAVALGTPNASTMARCAASRRTVSSLSVRPAIRSKRSSGI